MKIPSLFKSACFSLLTFFLFLLALEGVFRLARKDDALRLSVGRVDAKYHHTFEPGSALHLVSSIPGEFDVTAHINAFGFRGPEIPWEKKPRVERIFMVGDSFTFGVGANDEETIPALVEQYLNAGNPSPAYELINAGRGNTSPLIFYLRLKEELPQFRPDAVVMLLDFSDLWEDWRFERNLIREASGEPLRLSPYILDGHFHLWDYLRTHSVFLAYLHNKVVRTFLDIQKLGFKTYFRRVILERKRPKAVIATVSKNDTIEFDGKIFLRGRERAAEILEHFPRTAGYILKCRELAEKYGARFLLVLHPYGTHVGPDQWGKGRIYWGFEAGKLYTDLFSFDLVEKFAQENHIPFVNLLEDFRRHADQKLFFDYDGHFTPAANRVAAEALARHPFFRKT